MKIVFRVDSSNLIGSGHFFRCKTLALVMQKRGIDVLFISRNLEGNLNDILKEDSIPYILLPDLSKYSSLDLALNENKYSKWLGVSIDRDAEETILIISKSKPDWLIVDHYSLNIQWERKLRPFVKKIMVIEDLLERIHDCDLILDQNFSDSYYLKYKNRIPSHAKQLLGPYYALLQPIYRTYREELNRSEQVNKRIFLFMGGSDNLNATSKILKVLSFPDFKFFKIDVVVGSNNKFISEIEEISRERGNVTVHYPRPHLADLMSGANLAIGAGGGSTWERCCMGLPTLLISISDDQIPSSIALNNESIAKYAGHINDLDAKELYLQIQNFVSDHMLLQKMKQRSMILVDGFGALRVAEFLSPTPKELMYLRPATRNDLAQYFLWSNDIDVRENASNTEIISFESHTDWFNNYISNHDRLMYVLESAGLPIGQIRFDINGNTATINFSIDEIARGRGLETYLVQEGINELNKIFSKEIHAIVKNENYYLRNVFLKCHFNEHKINEENFSYTLSSFKN